MTSWQNDIAPQFVPLSMSLKVWQESCWDCNVSCTFKYSFNRFDKTASCWEGISSQFVPLSMSLKGLTNGKLLRWHTTANCTFKYELNTFDETESCKDLALQFVPL